MCGRSRATLDPQQVAAVLQLRLRGGAGAADEWAARCDDDAAARAPPRASVHPGTEVLVAHRADAAGAAALRVEPMVWGPRAPRTRAGTRRPTTGGCSTGARTRSGS